MKAKNVKRTERGWAGHFLCSHDCLFRRNTLLECGSIRIVISTVGGMLDLGRKPVQIGRDRYFETMAFHAEFDGRYWDAVVSRQINFDSKWAIDESDADDEANDMHEKVVEELMRRLDAGGEV